MGIYVFKPLMQKTFDPWVAKAVKAKIHPDWFSVAGLVFAVLAALSVLSSVYFSTWLLWVPVLAFLRLVMNVFDGQVARGLKLQDPFGEVKNEFGDRLADMIMLGIFVLVPGINLRLLVAAMVLVLLLNYLGILSKAIGGHRNYGGFMGKADRMFVLSVACVGAYGLQSVAVFNWMFWVIAMGALLSIGIRLRQIRQQNYS